MAVWEFVVNYLHKNPIELLGAVLTVICVWLNTQQNPWGWLVGILGIICYLWVFYQVRLVGDFLLNIYFLLTSLYGWYHWRYGKGNMKKLPISRLSLPKLMTYVIAGLVLGVIFGEILARYTSASVPRWDAIATTFSVIAQWLLAKKKVESWGFWIFVNVIYVGIFLAQELFATMLVYAILLALAIKGYWQWKLELISNN